MSENQPKTSKSTEPNDADAKKNERLKRLHQLRMKQVCLI